MPKPKIQVCGDPTVDWMTVHNEAQVVGGGTYWFPPETSPSEVRLSSQAGGSALMFELAKAMLPAGTVDVSGVDLDDALLTQPIDSRITSAWTAWAPYKSKDHAIAYRLKEWLDCEPGEWDYAGKALTGKADLLVIEDSGIGFRNCEKGWPQALTSDGNLPQRVILKLAQYGDGDGNELVKRLVALGLGPKTTVLTAITDLRACAVKVGLSLSWESILDEIIAAVCSPKTPFWGKDQPDQKERLRFEHVIVTIGASGAVMVTQPDEEHIAGTLIFDRKGQEGDFARELAGGMMGYNTAVSGALAASWAVEGESIDWAKAVLNGVGLARMLHLHGYDVRKEGNEDLPHLHFPCATLAKTFWERQPAAKAKAQGFARRKPVSEELAPDIKVAWNLGQGERVLGIGQKPDRDWTFLEQSVPADGSPACGRSGSATGNAVCKHAREIAIKGPRTALPDVPVEAIGLWQSADRTEIEGVRSVLNAFNSYLSSPGQKPLSIAVFGPPGAGKSFVVKQIAERLEMKKESRLTFNLSQFKSPDELPEAFHQIRDLHLRGEMPLVFWDEFDTPCEAVRLGWLRHFLAPMQDGEFSDAGRLYATGGGIYVFAGATSHSFDEFCSDDCDGDRDAKKPDFVSRLRAYMDVRGVNGQPNSVEDELFPIRRAFLLNSLLERFAKHLKTDNEFRLEEGVLDAFLMTTKYRHGARSMEAIVNMSDLAGKKKYELSSLPPENVLRMHVDTREFTFFTGLQYRDMLRVGITGHIGLDPDKLPVLQAGVKQAVDFIRAQFSDRYLTVFSPLAVGADRLVARELLSYGATRLIAVLPVPQDDYINDFGSTDAHHEDYHGAELRQEFTQWLAERAVEIIEMRPAPTRDRAYFNAGQFIAENCDVMIAVWDGKKAQGLGGTGDIVRVAKRSHKPICHVWAGNFKKNPEDRTEAEGEDGQVRHVNFGDGAPGEWIDGP